MTYDNGVEFVSRCRMCKKSLEILKGMSSTALISLFLKGQTYDAWLCDGCAESLIGNPQGIFADAVALVNEEEYDVDSNDKDWRSVMQVRYGALR
jgi:hypothetical protein